MFRTFINKPKLKPRPHDATDLKALAIWEKYEDPTYYRNLREPRHLSQTAVFCDHMQATCGTVVIEDGWYVAYKERQKEKRREKRNGKQKAAAA
jgi:hypothetical protein